MRQRPQTINEVLERNALLHKEKTAVFFPDYEESISFRELYEHVNNWAAYLSREGVKNGDIVGMVLKDARINTLGYLAIGRLGAICAPFDPQLPADKIYGILSSLRAKHIITEKRFENLFIGKGQCKITVVNNKSSIRDLAARISKYSSMPLPDNRLNSLGDWIYLYTSGSTDYPKIVRMHHLGFIRNAMDVQKHLGITDGDCFYSLTSLFHAHGFYNGLLLPLCCGASTVILEAFTVFHIHKFWQHIYRFKVSVINIVPAILEMLSEMKSLPMSGQSASLRFAICGTAPLKEEKRLRFEKLYGLRIIRQYGLTETLINAIEPSGKRKPDSVGVPVGCSIKITDEKSKEVKFGEIGEILIKSRWAMNGYFEPKDSNGKFFRNRWFKTGDLGRFDENGYLFIVGRKKDIIIKGGENIFPQDINNVIAKRAEVKEVVTVGMPDDFYGEEIYSFVVLKNGRTKKSAADYIAWCRKFLKASYCPRRVVLLDKLPKGPTGKIQLKRLKEDWLKKIKSPSLV